MKKIYDYTNVKFFSLRRIVFGHLMVMIEAIELSR